MPLNVSVYCSSQWKSHNILFPQARLTLGDFHLTHFFGTSHVIACHEVGSSDTARVSTYVTPDQGQETLLPILKMLCRLLLQHMTKCSIFSMYMQFNNFAWIIYVWASIGVTGSYSSRLFLCALIPRYIVVHKVFMSLILTSMLEYQYDLTP